MLSTRRRAIRFIYEDVIVAGGADDAINCFAKLIVGCAGGVLGASLLAADGHGWLRYGGENILSEIARPQELRPARQLFAAAPVRRFVSHAAADVAVLRSDEAHLWHFCFDFHWFKSRLFYALGQKYELILVLEVVGYILQIRSDIYRSAVGQVVGLAAGLLCKHIEARLRQIGAKQTTAEAS